jgi:predicted esterase
MAPKPPASTSTKPLKILMLHGYTQSGKLFRAKTGALSKAITTAFQHNVSFSFPTGPLALSPADIPGVVVPDLRQKEVPDMEAFGWWQRPTSTIPPIEYRGIEHGFRTVAQILRDEGPFDGVIGFSQGASFAVAVSSLLEEGRREAFASAATDKDYFPEAFLPENTGNHPPFKFCIAYSGFKFVDLRFRALYDPPVKTSMLHVMGSLDALVTEAQGRELAETCGGDSDVIFHPGGHFVPGGKRYLDVAVGFVRMALDKANNDDDDDWEEEERVEDMDVPF